MAISAVIGLCFLTSSPDPATALTAAEVLSKMNADERHTYEAGIVDGLAQARWIKDKPDPTGMKCTYDWFYKNGKKSYSHLEQLMKRHPDKQMSGLIYVLIKKECGW